MFFLTVYDQLGRKHQIGSVKIGQVGLEKGEPDLPTTFTKLDVNYFSLGQDSSFYENLRKLGEETQELILLGLNDIAFDLELFDKVISEKVTKDSLLRSVSPASVRGQFNRLIRGGARLTPYEFKYTLHQNKVTESLTVEFSVEPNSNPPSNVHVVIGRNGVGKTHLLNNMARSLVTQGNTKSGSFYSEKSRNNPENFTGVVSVSFSAFDPFDSIPAKKDTTALVRYSYIGLKHDKGNSEDAKLGVPMSYGMLTGQFVESLLHCVVDKKTTQWKKAISKLESDPLFAEAALTDLLKIETEKLEQEARVSFEKLSSGHSLILLAITRLVETVEEKTLVLIDEPEAHLHPPLLSAFVRALSDLLIHRNGVAIVATHSPVVLQEVPKSCVWKIRRTGHIAKAERPSLETFGENIGTLTREVFGLEVTESGFHQLLKKALSNASSYDDILNAFKGQLGMEGRAIARGLWAEHQKRSSD